MTDLKISRTCAEALGITVEMERIPDMLQERYQLVMPYECNGLMMGFKYDPITDPAQNQECLWWLIRNAPHTIISKDELSIDEYRNDPEVFRVFPFATLKEFMRSVCLAICAVKGAGNE